MRKAYTIFLLFIAIALGVNAQQLAFPGADGYAKNITGGRGGKVYHVTRLDDCTDTNLVPGTLRWALRTGDDSPRTIVFDVAGTIYLASPLKTNHNNVSILGQSAPGGGICLTGYGMSISNRNYIVRYMRFRAGEIPCYAEATEPGAHVDVNEGSLGVENAAEIMLDHCSITWSNEECLTMFDVETTTVQHCIIGEGLYHSWHHKYENNGTSGRSFAMQWGGEKVTMHHTLITNCYSRSPRFNGVREENSWLAGKEGIKAHAHDVFNTSEFSNNVIFNWGRSGGIYGGEFYRNRFADAPGEVGKDYFSHTLLQNNYYRPGPATKQGASSSRYWVDASGDSDSERGQWYFNGNKFEVDGTYSSKTGVWAKDVLEKVNADNLWGFASGNSGRAFNMGGGNQSLYDKFVLKTIPYTLSGYQLETADEAYANTLADCGATLPRLDEVDQRLVDEAAGRRAPQFKGSRVGTQGLGIIDTPNDIKLTGKQDKFYHNGELTNTVNGQTFTCYPYLGLNEGERYAIDSDADGMPDAYEDAMGFSKTDPADGSAIAANGYSNLENYLNGLADGSLKASDYQTSNEFVEPGLAVIPETITITFANTDTSIEGTVPTDVTIPYGSAYAFKPNTSIYKEGYTMVGWTDGNMTFDFGKEYSDIFTQDVTLKPSMAKNNTNLADRTDDITITWDFKAAEAPSLAGKGIYVTRAHIDADTLDVKLSFSNNAISLPACKGAIATIIDNSGSRKEYASTTDNLSIALNNLESLAAVELILPFRFNPEGINFHSPSVGKCDIGTESYITIENGLERVWTNDHNASNASGFKSSEAKNYELMYGNLATIKQLDWIKTIGQERDAYRNCIDPIKDDGTFSGDGASTAALDGFIVGASQSSTYKLVAYVKDCARVRTFISGSNSTGDQVQLIALPADDSERIVGSNLHLLNKSTVWSETFDMELDADKQYMLIWSSVGGLDMMIGAVKFFDKTGAGADSGEALVMWPWQGNAEVNGNASPAKAFASATANATGFGTIGSTEASGVGMCVTLKPSLKVTERTAEQMVEFRIKPAAGYTFRPSSLSFYGAMTATSGGNLDIFTQQGNKAEDLKAQYVFNNIGERAIALDGYEASGDDFIIRFYCYNLAAKQLLYLCNIAVNGEYTKTAAPKHNIATAVNPEEAGVISQTPKGSAFAEGAELAFTATAVDGYKFLNWTNSAGKVLSEESKFVFTVGSTDETITANFQDLSEGGIFNDGPFQAIVSNAEELKDALLAAKQSTAERYYIFLKNGLYDLGTVAKTAIPQNTSLIGESQDGVTIKNNPGTVTSSYQDKTPTLFIDQNQNDVYLQDLTICQERDWIAKKSQGQAIALRQRGKRAIYKNITLQGVQDTYYLNKADASAYFETSTIAGNVDYIYGDGTMWFEKCHIQHIGNNGGYIVAPNTQTGYMGIVLNDCDVTSVNGDKSFYFGRPWGDSPAATFLGTTFNALPMDAGWAGMSDGCVIRFHEYGSKDKNGNLLDLSKRSIAACKAASGSDAPVLTAEEAATYTIENVFKKVANGWSPQLLTIQLEASTLFISKEKRQLTWEPVDDAYAYAIVKNGNVIGFTDQCFFDIKDTEAKYQLRVANMMGGLGTASAVAIEGWYDSISEVSTASAAAAGKTYNIAGQIVTSHTKGIVINNGKKFIRK